MKKIFIILFLLAFLLCACNKNENALSKEENASTKKEIDMNEYNDLYIQINSAKTISNYDNINNIDDADIIIFGKYEIDGDINNGLEDIKWVLADKDENKAILVSKDILDCKSYLDMVYFAKNNIAELKNVNNIKKYNDVIESYGGDKLKEEFKENYGPLEKVSWEKCTLREWLNKEFYNTAFNLKDQQYILQYDISDDKNNLKNKYDNCFCLSLDEMRKYFKFNYSSINNLAYAYPTAFAKKNANFYNGIEIREEPSYKGYSDYWFRTSVGNDNIYTSLPQINHNYTGSYSMFGFRAPGNNNEPEIVNYAHSQEKNIGVRPAICINLNVDDVKNKLKNLSTNKNYENNEKERQAKSIKFTEDMCETYKEAYGSDNNSTSAFGSDNNEKYNKKKNNGGNSYSNGYYDPFEDFFGDDFFRGFGF